MSRNAFVTNLVYIIPKLFIACAIVIATLNLCSCVKTVKIEGIKPIKPEYQGANPCSSVDSLLPEFRWQPAAEPGTSYDLIIWNTVEKPKQWGEFRRYGNPCAHRYAGGEQVYYAEDIKDSFHVLTTPLKPDSCYAWSVRERRGSVVGSWSNFNANVYSLGVVVGDYMSLKNSPYFIFTPKAD